MVSENLHRITRLEAARRAKGWTQTTLAYRARMAQSDISAIERGRMKPWPKHAARLAKILDVPVDQLTDGVVA